MALTYEPIASTTLASGANTITFNSIPQTYTDLKLVFFAKNTSGNKIELRFNSNTSSYFYANMYGDRVTMGAFRTGNSSIFETPYGLSVTSGIWGLYMFDIFSYATNQNTKTGLVTFANDSDTSGIIHTACYSWNNSSAITSLSVGSITVNDNYVAGTRATLYGIKAA